MPDETPFAVFTDQRGEDFSLGIEEEFFVVDAETRALREDAPEILGRAVAPEGSALEGELKRSQVESGSAVCRDLGEVRRSVVALRRVLGRAAEEVGARLVASGTHPFARWGEDGGLTEKAAYIGLHEAYGLLTVEQVLSGCHVHVGIRDPELAVSVMNRIRPWLPVLAALSSNSPYWMGQDSRYASFRTEVFGRWPMAGIAAPFRDRAEYDRVVDELHRVEAIDAPGRLYWLARPSARYPTLEVRVGDVLTTIDECVAFAAIVRALVEVLHAEAVTGTPVVHPRGEVLRSALWRGARYGLTAELVDLDAGCLAPAAEIVDTLLARVRPVLEARGEWEEVSTTVGFVLRAGTGAERQRRTFEEQDGSLDAVIDRLAIATTAGTV